MRNFRRTIYHQLNKIEENRRGGPFYPFYQHGWTLNLAWISNYICCKVWDKVDYLLPNSNGVAVEAWEWTKNPSHILLGIWLFIHAGI